MSTAAFLQLPPAVRTYAERYVARARRAALWRALGRATAFTLAFALLSCAADRVWQLPTWGRLSLLSTAALIVVAILFRPLRAALRRTLDWQAAAADIEAHSPQFAEGLMTVISRVLGPAEHRGSDEMLYHLLRDVDRQAGGRIARPAPRRRVFIPWLTTFILLGGIWLILTRAPDWRLHELLHRFALPTANVPPVTTTRIEVVPGDINLPQSKSLRVAALATRLPPDGGVTIVYSKDGGQSWSHAAMLPPGEGTDADRFEFTLGAVDRDVRYFVTAGDATTPEYRARVLRPPSVARFTVRYVYPEQAQRPPLTVTNTDGLIEAPAGTEAVLTVEATEPLLSAQLRVGQRKTVMLRVPGEDDRVRQAKMKIERDSPYEVDLISTRSVAGGGPASMKVHAVPDAAPLVRLIQPSGALRLNPREIVPLTYEALDDYGIESLNVTVQSTSSPTATFPLQIRGDARRQEDTYALDLASVGLKVGDLVTVTITAKDRSSKQASCEPLQILISPRSVDVDTHVRVSELSSASGMVSLVVEELEAATAAVEEAERERNAKNLDKSTAAMTRCNKHVSSAAEMAALVRQALLRAVVRADSPELSTALSFWIDNLQVLASLTDDLFLQKSMSADTSGSGGDSRQRLSKLVDLGRRSRDDLKIVAQGEQADALLADRENLKATEAAPGPKDGVASERRKQTIQRARDEIAVGVKHLGLDPNAGNLDDRLKDRKRAAEERVKSRKGVDFIEAAKDWSQALQRDASKESILDDRLATAAQAEAVRPFAELVRARDLHLAGRAAAAIAATAAADKAAKRVVGAGAPNQFVQALAALEREHDYDRKPRKRGKGEDAAIRNAAQQARQVLAGYAGDSGAAVAAATTAPAGRSTPAERAVRKRAEELALRASAAAARREYDEAERLDESLITHVVESTAGPATAPSGVPGVALGPTLPSARLVEQKQRIARTMKDARQLDQLEQDQDKLVDQTSSTGATVTNAPPQLVAEQQRVVTAIAGVQGRRASIAASVDLTDPNSDPNWRSKATAAVVAAQEQLAAMPQRLAEARQASITWHDAIRRTEDARRMAKEAKGEARVAAERAARQMEQDSKDAEDRLLKQIRPVLPAAADALADRLAPFAPEASAARDVVSQQLVPALREMELALAKKEGDPNAGDRAASAARAAIEAAQSQLASAQESFTARDPLVAAKWFARAAAESLQQSPPNLKAAQQRQSDATAALARAWDQTIHDAAAQRLGVVPSMPPLYAPPAYAPRGGPDTASNAPAMAAVREWSRMRPRESEASLSAPLRDADPPGYEEALQKYFESLGKAGGKAQ